jgi:hypothetical protein
MFIAINATANEKQPSFMMLLVLERHRLGGT